MAAKAARVITTGTIVLILIAIGWFMLSWRVMHTPAGDAAGEALGVTFALLIVVSVVGAIRRNPE
jgi:hypothetical protein